ncbi:MAG: NADH-quinone oxidoreductase subunit NuoK [Candidatus Tectomicrobia bacterium]|uniref:NADH-quinone oxidoreductase subunit K n=1 Tax=Tectimicrobiota bacterium TaxID=2528274 RepID=A0A932GMR7_UNCTE|nr:NADH-quinone oxidoreductase subunit NuoK [Candidatus Tectomicrobia bacterium]
MPLSYYLILGALLFIIGAVGVLTRRHALVILMSIELMLNAVNITLVAFSRMQGNLTGQVFSLFIIAVAAAEAAVGLAIVIVLFNSRETLNIDEINLMKW